MLEESNAGAKKYRRDVDVNLVEKPSIEQLLNGVGAVDRHGFPGSGGFGLLYGAVDAVRDEVDRRVGSRPSGGDLMSNYECRSPGVISAPTVSNLESASTGEHGTELGPETAKVPGARLGHIEGHGVRPSGVELHVSGAH